jgi:hypothetical protein
MKSLKNGLNSTLALIGVLTFVIYLQALKISYARSITRRDKKGMVSRMRRMAVRFSGRKLAATLAATCSGAAVCVSEGSS